MNTERRDLNSSHVSEALSVLINALALRNGVANVFRLFALLLAAFPLTGCETLVGTTISVANRVDEIRLRGRAQDMLREHLKYIRDLQAKGDPLGDYLWTAANARGWVENPVLDPEKLKEMYEIAAAKGSSDALVALGVMLVTGQTTQQGMAGKRLEKTDWRRGLTLIEQGTKERCWYWQSLVSGVGNSHCLRPYSPGSEIWPEFRDGWVVPKNEELANHWRERDKACKQTPAYKQAHQFCN